MSTTLFLAALAFLGIERIFEIFHAKRNARRILDAGGRFVPKDGMGMILLVHVGIFVLASLEFFLAPWAGLSWISWVGLGIFVIGDLIRFWAIGSLGFRWNTRVYVLPGAPLVARGPYKFLPHPNYVGVVLVLIGFPLIFQLYGTLLVIGGLNALALARRIRLEDEALAGAVG